MNIGAYVDRFDVVNDYLCQMMCIVCYSVMQSLPTRQKRVGRLLDIIPTRGAKAFTELIHGLVLTKQTHIAEILDRDLTQQYGDQEECEEEVVDSGTAPVPKKTVDEKVSEIRMFLCYNGLVYFLLEF